VHPDAKAIVERLGLVPHPEGGYYRETHRCGEVLPLQRGPRAISTAVYFLLPAGSFSAFHRIRSEEVWHHYAGDPLELHLIAPDGALAVHRLGPSVAHGERPQHLVPAGWWQAARPLGHRYALCGCTVAPGFDFADLELADRMALLKAFPALRGTIEALTRI
jgi:hypothetical protein